MPPLLLLMLAGGVKREERVASEQVGREAGRQENSDIKSCLCLSLILLVETRMRGKNELQVHQFTAEKALPFPSTGIPGLGQGLPQQRILQTPRLTCLGTIAGRKQMRTQLLGKEKDRNS